ncbi:hypothetical protein HPB52_003263 [Rhipicephalus sanguineus]|uniref:Uncharacterized protein n=1 Tax=Rhipicephalus sanguineus TaxID=34632 RepID=A0A9D4Q4N4_RHISA|nr:hypothetical protein HPB52_003263 [Rhipicephalus sanguineus]
MCDALDATAVTGERADWQFMFSERRAGFVECLQVVFNFCLCSGEEPVRELEQRVVAASVFGTVPEPDAVTVPSARASSLLLSGEVSSFSFNAECADER